MPPELHPGAEVLAVAESPGADETRHRCRIDIDHPPRTHAPNGRTVVHLLRVDRDDVSRPGPDRSDAGPRRVTARANDADAELIVRVTGEPALRRDVERIDAGQASWGEIDAVAQCGVHGHSIASKGHRDILKNARCRGTHVVRRISKRGRELARTFEQARRKLALAASTARSFELAAALQDEYGLT